jgi:sugar lactone lactonase YvrE
VATDSASNVYVSDGRSIRKISPAATVTSLAAIPSLQPVSNCYYGLYPAFSGIALDTSGNVYVVDSSLCAIDKITPAGAASPLAGGSFSGHADGIGAAASFSAPTGIAADAAGNIYVADTEGHEIRKITSAAVVTTMAGSALQSGSADGEGAPIRGSADGTRTAASFNDPWGVAADAAGNLYVADNSSNTIRQVSPAGTVTTLAGTAGNEGDTDNATGAAATFSGPTGVALGPDGGIYVTDNVYVRKVQTGSVTTLAGQPWLPIVLGCDGDGPGGCFSYPYGVAVDSAGNVYVSDMDNNNIRKITSGGVVSSLAGPLAYHDMVWLNNPGLVDGLGTLAQFDRPAGMTIDASGNLYLADNSNNAIRMITPAGMVTTISGFAQNGNAVLGGSADGPVATATFKAPSDVALDSAGNIYVADTGNSLIRKISTNGIVSTIAGTRGVVGFKSGLLPGVIHSPEGVVVSGTSLYIAMSGGIAVINDINQLP